MQTVRLIWCHGSLSAPWGTKSKGLAQIARAQGLAMEGIDFQDLDNPDKRVDRLLATLNGAGAPAILCGSSMGGYVAASAASRFKTMGLFLLAPAFYLPGYRIQAFNGLPEHVTVIHGWQDETVPVDNSIRFAQKHNAELHLLPDSHRLANSSEMLEILFSRFLRKVCQTPPL